MPDFTFGLSELLTFLTVVAIDVALAGDNAIVVGMSAAGLPPEQRRKAIGSGILVAALMRILFALVAVRLLGIVGLTAGGGLLLLWVSWRLWRELRQHKKEAHSPQPTKAAKTLRQAVVQIAVADLSMSLDNVLAVAGAARDHVWVMVLGLALSVALMGLAASLVARLIERFRWIAYGGLLIIFYVSLSMIWAGAQELHAHFF